MKYKIGDKLLAFPYEDMPGHYRGDDYGNPIAVEVVECIETLGLDLYKVLEPDGFHNVYNVKELFRTQDEIDEIAS